ncbi:NADH-FMN oxidoreductase RutF, flavin reductase (DIM6/NTAB) family [Aquimarina amphilecti]|uniref:NADH-FMN oxidoreductase RutF, flavin reductase (DIM6/NTAB) family n=1 Tax=Aquimarina amphilecti TaxID=1038014 RepID=A0A1H7FL42_AQUAM|nr:flavin reductase [Aquimarina amphilecti]SEK24840.1 NADH-FMN oxidoreductase RutF, flavin reductase (DIM6/NTAB) family [Aquimarina amphilecti]
MHYTKEQIENMERVKRLKIINSVSGIKPANLIGTIDDTGKTNVAIFSSVVHLGSDPALMGFIMRPIGEVPRHTYENIMQNKQYTINHIHQSFVKNAHYTSAKLDRNDSEFEKCGLTEEFITDFKAPFVRESNLKVGLQFLEAIEIPLNGTILMIGEIKHLILPEEIITDQLDLDLGLTNTVGISGLNTYYALEKIEEFPYARASEIPNF